GTCCGSPRKSSSTSARSSPRCLCRWGGCVWHAPRLLGGSTPVRAAAMSGVAPEVDSLTVRVVIDSYQFAVAPSKKTNDVDIRHFGWGIDSSKPPGRTLVSEFGLSMHVESSRAAEKRQVLIDFGYTPGAPINNLELLDIDPADLDAL